MSKLASLVLVLVLAACGGSKAPATTAPADPAASAAAAVTWTLVSVTNADTSCTIELHASDGETKMLDGDYDLCPNAPHDATGLIGQPVTITTERGNVMAPECEGNPDCGKSVEVDIVKTIVAAPAPTP